MGPLRNSTLTRIFHFLCDAMAKLHVRPPIPSILPAPLLQAIGAVISNWAALEASLELAICDLYELPKKRALILTSNLSFNDRLGLIRICATTDDEMLGEPEGKALRALLTPIQNAFGERNRVAHAVWTPGTSPQSGFRSYIRAKGDHLKTVREEISVGDLERTAVQFVVLSRAFAGAVSVFRAKRRRNRKSAAKARSRPPASKLP